MVEKHLLQVANLEPVLPAHAALAQDTTTGNKIISSAKGQKGITEGRRGRKEGEYVRVRARKKDREGMVR